MNFICNFPLFMIIGSLFSAALCLLLPRKAALILEGVLLSVLIVLDAIVLRFTALHGEFTYSMGEFPAPWGNEIRAGTLEALVLLIFLVVILLSLALGHRYLQFQIDESKQNLFYALTSLAVAAVCALVFTNDLFTGYVFLEVLTLSSCGLIVAREVGRTTLAATRYMIMNLLGSGLFLLGVVMLYGMTGHLLMVPLHESIVGLAQDPAMIFPLTIIVGIMTIGLSIKSGLFPFYFWMPDTYGWSTPTTASIMSSVVSKAYIFLLIKVYYRVIGMEFLEKTPLPWLLFALGIAGMIFGSVSAIRAGDLNRMVAFSSAAQIGYIYMSIGIGGEAGYIAAVFHMLSHSVTKSLIFLTTPRLADMAGGSLVFKDLQGAALKDRAAGFFFLTASLSMIGIPVFSGFTAKLLITVAAEQAQPMWVLFITIAALAASTAMNAFYFLRTTVRIYAHRSDEVEHPFSIHHTVPYLIHAGILMAINLYFGLYPIATYNLIEQGLHMLS